MDGEEIPSNSNEADDTAEKETQLLCYLRLKRKISQANIKGSNPISIGASLKLKIQEDSDTDEEEDSGFILTGDERTSLLRKNIISDLLESEKYYVKTLTTIVERIYFPLREKNFIDKEELKIMFADLEFIYGINKAMLADIVESMEKWEKSTQMIGSVFLKFAPFLKMYFVYVKSYSENLEKFRKFFQINEFKVLVQNTMEEDERGFLNILSEPILRVSKYESIVKALRGYTPKAHPDYENLVSAEEKLNAAALYMLAKKREYEKIQRVLDTQNTLAGKFKTLLTPTRQLIKDGKLMYIVRGSPKEHYFMLFNDALVIAKENRTGWSLSIGKKRNKSYVGEIEFEDVISLQDIESQVRNGFSIRDKTQTFTIACSSYQEKENWMNEIRKLLPKTAQQSDIKSKAQAIPVKQVNERQIRKPSSIKHKGGAVELPRMSTDEDFTIPKQSPPTKTNISSSPKSPNKTAKIKAFFNSETKSESPKPEPQINELRTRKNGRISKSQQELNFRSSPKQIINMLDIISDERGYYYFHQFLKAEFAEENLEFWAEAEALAKIEIVPKETLQKIFEKYILPNIVNIPSFVQKDIEAAFTSGDVDKTVFDAAQEAVIDNLRFDNYPRFLQSTFFSKLMIEMRKSTKVKVQEIK